MKSYYIIILCIFPFLKIYGEQSHVDSLFIHANNMSLQGIINLGNANQKNPDTAIAIFSLANKKYNKSMSEEEKKLCITSFIKTGDLYYKIGNYTNAFDNYLQGLKICESCRKLDKLPDIYLKLGTVYCTFQDYGKGLIYYKRALRLSRFFPDRKREYNILSNMTGVYCMLNNAGLARETYKLLKKKANPKDPLESYLNLHNLGFIYLIEKNYHKAIQVLHKSISIVQQNKLEDRYICTSYEELYDTFFNIQQNDSALYYLNKCTKLAQKQSWLTYILAECYQSYSKYYEKMGDNNMSLLYKGKYLTLMDSIYNGREYNRVKNLQSIYEMEMANKKVADLNMEKNLKDQKIKAQRKFILTIFGIFIVISSFLVIVYRQKKRLALAYGNLFNVNREIIQSELHNRKLREEYEQKIKDLQKEHFPQIETAENDATNKYQSSKLNDEQRQLLKDAINQIMERTHEYCSEDFSLDKLAELTSSNIRYVSQVINETYHKNFNNFVNEYRIQEARVRLIDVDNYGQYTIKAIASSLGYKSTTTFNNAFKEITGFTPSAFQRMAKEKCTKTYDR